MSTDLPAPVAGVLLGLLVVSSASWLGGWVTLVVVARSTTATLSRRDRVAFFRHFGPRFGIVATVALLVAYLSGVILLAGTAWTTLSSWLVVLAVVMLLVLGVGVLQARRMTRLRRAAVAAPDDAVLAARVRRGGRGALVLRSGLGALSLAMVVLAVIRVA
ncbi:MAG: hypothetical protein EPN48_05370 [Microbacteriaceae bacterium]|nr:MAG: hypothetical protein EPN48_05370 [Microbacteriaceae bacterium]